MRVGILFSLLFSLLAFSPHCVAVGELKATVIELSVELDGRKVIDGAVLEALDGKEARLGVYETEDMDAGVVVNLSVLSETADLFGAGDAQDATFVDVAVSSVGGDKSDEIAKATLGVMPGKLGSVTLEGAAITISLRVVGIKAYALDSDEVGKINQCGSDVVSLGGANQAKSSCCTKKCVTSPGEFMRCCNAICCT